MVNNYLNKLRLLFKFHKLKMIVIIASILALLIIVEVVLNIWIRHSLKQAFIAAPEPDTKIDASINWISIIDFKKGKIRRLNVKGWNCTLSKLKFKEISVVSKGFRFDFNSLARDRQLRFTNIASTQVKAVISALELTKYLVTRYPNLKPAITIESGKLNYIGELEVWGNPISLQVEGSLQVSSLKKLRFYPEKLQVLNRKIPDSVLKFIGTQLPLEFAVLEEWPLKITDFSLNEGFMRIIFEEIPINSNENRY